MSNSETVVFFYGLFMDEALLASKGVHATDTAIGYVDGYGLRIGERATLIHDPGGRAYGVVMKLPAEGVAALYSDPSVTDYIAEPVMVSLPGDAEVSAVCYNLPVDKLAGANPEYATALLALATGLGLPDSYLSQIRNFCSR